MCLKGGHYHPSQILSNGEFHVSGLPKVKHLCLLVYRAFG